MLLLAIVLAFVGLIIFLALIPVNQWLWAGWLFGTGSILIGHGLGVLLVKVLFRKKRTKLGGVFGGICRTMINYFLQCGMFFILIGVNTSYHHVEFFNSGAWVLADGPIVFYTYIAGISIVGLAGIATLLLKKREGKDERIRR